MKMLITLTREDLIDRYKDNDAESIGLHQFKQEVLSKELMLKADIIVFQDESKNIMLKERPSYENKQNLHSILETW